MRTDDVLLVDIIECAESVSRYLQGATREQFVANEMLRDAVLMRLVVIGESAKKLSDSLKRRHATVPWPKTAALRNLAVHDYFGVDWPLVWSAATDHLPPLHSRSVQILKDEFPEAHQRFGNKDRPSS